MAVARARAKKIEKDAWDWAENVDCDAITNEHLEKVYRLNLGNCGKINHKSNCRGNPNCLNILGERCWLKELDDNVWYTWDDPEKETRPDGSFVGLKNLGATCYVNTFLQVWFHNVQFRSVLYSWIPLYEPSMSQAPSKSDMETDEVSNETAPADIEMSLATTYNIIKSIGTDFKKSDEHTQNNEPESTNGNNVEKSDQSTNVCPPMPECTPWEEDRKPKSFCHHLQLLFAQLQYTSRRFIDPAPFVDSLGLDKEQQQDAQEFCKLFMSLLEDTLSQQPDVTLRNIVQQQFGGTYVYVTKCSNCGKQSQRNSQFYELDLNIHGHTSLSQCVKEFLKKEDLDGDNQYYCSYCTSKQDATRHIKLKQLPPVLNLQLLRFVFDRKTGYKKKLNNNIFFPEVLDMNDYVESSLEGCVYDLTAVLIHRGLSAYSGHYVAHIKDKESGCWYRFNDESIEKMKGKSLRLDSEEDLHDGVHVDDTNSNSAKKMKYSKGSSSKDAYMLVYTQRGEEKQVIAQDPPPDIQELVARDNSKIDAWLEKVKAIQKTMAFRGRERQNEIRRVCEILPAEEAKDYEWCSTAWLRKWLGFDEQCSTPIDNSSLICPHGRLNPDKVVCAKRISVKVADFFYKRYGGFPRLKSDSFCMTCVRERCESLQFSSRLNEDQKFINKGLKTVCERTGFWVSKNSLRRWKAMAQNIHGLLNPKSPSSVEENSPSSGLTEEISKSSEGNVSVDAGMKTGDDGSILRGSECASLKSDLEKRMKFNEDLTCEHGCLSTSATSRRLVTSAIWKRLVHYFPDAPGFSWRHNSCSTCVKHDQEVAKRIESSRKLAVEQRSLLGNLYYERERPEFNNQSVMTCYALSRTFYEEWRKFLRAPTRCARPSGISNKTLICPHGGFLYQPECNDNDSASSSLVYLWGMEWSALCQVFGFDLEIKIIKELDEDKEQYLITPECCVQCNAALVSDHFSEAEIYERAQIYVRKITDQHTKDDVQAILESYTSPEAGLDDIIEPNTPPQFTAGNTPKAPHENRRRSSRHRRQRGEVVLTVDSFDTVRDIKLRLMKQFSVMPSDQHLSVNGKVLEDGSVTAGVVGIRPGSILLLKMDEPEDGLIQEEMAKETRKPEEGFKGTSLLKHTPMTI